METDLWSDPHDGFIAEMFLSLRSELLQLVSSMLNCQFSVLGQSNRGSLSLTLPSLSSSFHLSILHVLTFLFFLEF